LTSRPWHLVILLCATATASYLCRVNLSVAGALLMPALGLSQIQLGRVFSAFILGYALLQIPAGMLADRWGARRVLAAAAFAWAAATGLTAAAGWGWLGHTGTATLAILLALRCVLGACEAPTFPAAAQGVARWIPPAQQGRANGIVLAGVGLGSALAPPLLSTVMTRWGWRTALLVSALPALGVALAWLRVREPEAAHLPPSQIDSTSGGAARQPASAPVTAQVPGAGVHRSSLRSLRFVLLTASYTLQGYVGYIFVFWFYLYLVEERHFDLLRGAAFSSLPWILSIVSIPLGGIVSDRLVAGRLGIAWGRRAVPLAGLTFAGIFLAVGAQTRNAYGAVACLTLATALVLSVEGPFWATMMEIAESNTGAAGGVMNMGTNVGGFISPALTPILAARWGWTNALYVAAAISVLAALLWLGISPETSHGQGRGPTSLGHAGE
jgi:ACS family glucarate transporter-like MFS transporter